MLYTHLIWNCVILLHASITPTEFSYTDKRDVLYMQRVYREMQLSTARTNYNSLLLNTGRLYRGLTHIYSGVIIAAEKLYPENRIIKYEIK